MAFPPEVGTGRVTQTLLDPTSCPVTPGDLYELSGYLSKNGNIPAQVSVGHPGGNRRITVPANAPTLERGRFSVRWRPGAGTGGTAYLIVGAGTGTVDL